MKATDIMHPDDAKAILVLRKMKGFDRLIRGTMEYGYEKIFRGQNLGNMVKVNASNYSELHRAFEGVVRKVGIEKPELYIYNDPVMNAYTYGEKNTFIALSNSLVEKMSMDEVRSIIAHECGHILCKHTFYNTLLRTIEELGYWMEFLSYATYGPILIAMQYWSRKSELSADRCAAVVVGERVYQTSMLKLTSGMAEVSGNPYQLVEQAKEYRRFMKESLWNRIQQNCRVAFNSHPQMCERAYEIDRWKNSWQYRRLIQMN